jgi:tRNA G18 (ribose-2'-O)-methylase SpoU
LLLAISNQEQGKATTIAIKSAINTIESRHNRQLIRLRKLMNSSEARHAEGVLLVDGERFCRGLSGVRELFVAKSLVGQIETFAGMAEQVYAVDDGLLESVSVLKNNCKAIAVCPVREVGEYSDRFDCVAVPANLQDPGNLGSLARSLMALVPRPALVWSPGTADPTSPRAVRASAGAMADLPISFSPSLNRAIADLRASGYWLLGLDGAAREDIFGVDMRQPLAVIIGSEGTGMGEPVKARLDGVVRIPLLNGVDSLNAAVAGSIALAVFGNRLGWH